MSTKQTVLERDLVAAQKRRDELETRRELLQKEHRDGVTARRALMLDNDGDLNLKALEKADTRVATVEVSLGGTEDALNAVREKIRTLDVALASAKDQQEREAKAVVIEGRCPKLKNGIVKAEPSLRELIAELGDCGLPEGQAAAMLLEDSWQQVVREIGKISSELLANARALRSTPTRPPETFRPQGALVEQKWRSGDVPDTKFVDWDEARRLQR